MEFRTVFDVKPSQSKISYHDTIAMFGSCFVENIGLLLQKRRFSVCLNPYGILYNPLSIHSAIDEIVSKKIYSKSDLIFFNDKWLSLNHHGCFSAKDINECLLKINTSINEAYVQLQKAKLVFITLGTSIVYFDKNTDLPVGNCHKLPSTSFYSKRLKLSQTVQALTSIVDKILDLNPDAKIVFTVSPIRHWKDGAVENQRSKSTLILGIDEISAGFNCVEYFPAYELMIDDLRDYRFYKEDMLHPNEQAVNYIWEIFKSTYIDNDSLAIMKEVEKLLSAQNHKTEDVDTKEFIKFQEYISALTKSISERYPFLSI